MESAAKSTDKALGLYGMIHYGIIGFYIVQNCTFFKSSDTIGKIKYDPRIRIHRKKGNILI